MTFILKFHTWRAHKTIRVLHTVAVACLIMNSFYSLPDHLQTKITSIKITLEKVDSFISKIREDYQDRSLVMLRQDPIGHVVLFFCHLPNLSKLTEIVRGPRASMGKFDWFVTSYARQHNLPFCNSYKQHLKVYTKSGFDLFCRARFGSLQFIDIHGETFMTSIGQLRFMQWVMTSGAYDFWIKNTESIQADFDTQMQHARRSRQTN